MAPLSYNLTPTPVHGGLYRPPAEKWQLLLKIMILMSKELKLRDLSYISMTNPPIPFLGLKVEKKGFLKHFCCQQFQYQDHEFQFFSLFWAKMTRIVILDIKLIAPKGRVQ